MKAWLGTERGQLEGIFAALQPRCVWEWGAGGSSIEFPRLFPGIERWVAVEHDKQWADVVRANARSNVLVRAIAPERAFELADHEQYRLSEVTGEPFLRYVHSYCGAGRFDLVLVDGRARNACVRMAWAWSAPGTVIVLHDAQRTEYQGVLRLLGARKLEPWSQGQLAVIRKDEPSKAEE